MFGLIKVIKTKERILVGFCFCLFICFCISVYGLQMWHTCTVVYLLSKWQCFALSQLWGSGTSASAARLYLVTPSYLMHPAGIVVPISFRCKSCSGVLHLLPLWFHFYPFIRFWIQPPAPQHSLFGFIFEGMGPWFLLPVYEQLNGLESACHHKFVIRYCTCTFQFLAITLQL